MPVLARAVSRASHTHGAGPDRGDGDERGDGGDGGDGGGDDGCAVQRNDALPWAHPSTLAYRKGVSPARAADGCGGWPDPSATRLGYAQMQGSWPPSPHPRAGPVGSPPIGGLPRHPAPFRSGAHGASRAPPPPRTATPRSLASQNWRPPPVRWTRAGCLGGSRMPPLVSRAGCPKAPPQHSFRRKCGFLAPS